MLELITNNLSTVIGLGGAIIAFVLAYIHGMSKGKQSVKDLYQEASDQARKTINELHSKQDRMDDAAVRQSAIDRMRNNQSR